ncbi:hypothetical protein BD311DRAFT_763420 [Dichomitus squalens]|uniref:Secreted protein n=1 Tax=Dichomitus squalens TaxID=114155 RepID=A0A4Q9MFD0_9APHY|nr:hypothetical protein BD311DRAFT_763420 [Dichomitus squalens]
MRIIFRKVCLLIECMSPARACSHGSCATMDRQHWMPLRLVMLPATLSCQVLLTPVVFVRPSCGTVLFPFARLTLTFSKQPTNSVPTPRRYRVPTACLDMIRLALGILCGR